MNILSWVLISLLVLGPFAPHPSTVFGVQAAYAAGDLEKNLLRASMQGNLSEVKSRVDQGADVNSANSKGLTALMLASLQGHTDVVKFLLSKGAKVNPQDAVGTSALMAAARMGHLEIVKALVNAGADLSLKADNSLTALGFATAGNHSDVAAYLKSGAN